MSGVAVVIMAAGMGTRMKSAVPKMLHPVCGRPMVLWPVQAALGAGAANVIVVTGPGDELDELLPAGVSRAVQPEANGTGGAVLAAREAIGDADAVVVLSGDTPLVDAELVTALAATLSDSGAAMVIATATLDDATGYGRVVRDSAGDVERVAETKTDGDASAAELDIHEVNGGLYAFDRGALLDALNRVGNDNAQGEYYLPDVIGLLRGAGKKVTAYELAGPEPMLGVNSRVDLALVEQATRKRIVERHQLAGVTIVDPSSTWIDADVEIGPDTRIEPATMLRGTTRIGDGCEVGPQSTITDSVLHGGARVIHSYLVSCEVGPRASVGPFAYLRPDAVLGADSKVGTFVEVKNSQLGEGAKAPHLSYIGDTTVGPGSNLGAGTITANYDGREKHRTQIGAGAKIGVDTSLVAPVSVGDGAYTAAGSVITKDVPADALAVARARQSNIENYAQRKNALGKRDDGDDGE